MLLKSLVLAIFARIVLGDDSSSSSNSCSLSTTISAASAVLKLNSCPTLEGTIEITGNEVTNLDLSSVGAIDADLSIFNSSSITGINLGGLENVTGSLEVDALTQLHNIDFSKLTSAKKLSFVSLPSFAQLNLNSGLANVSSLTLSDTAISSIDKLLNFKTIGTLNVNNNKNISSIDLSSLETVTDGLTLSFNGDNATVKLENLLWAANLTIQDVADVSISSLESVNGSFVLAYNGFDSVEFDSLTKVGSSLSIFANDELEELSLANLTEIDGEFRLFNNSKLKDIELDSLETIKGALSMKGDFGNFTLPKLKEVDGDFSVQSTSDDFSCDAFNKLHNNNKIKGHNYNCSSPSSSVVSSGSASATLSSKSTGSGSSSSSSGSSGSSSKASGANYLAPGMVISTLIGAAFACLM